MSNFAEKFNKKPLFDIDTTGFEYKKVSELETGTIYPLRGIYINKKSKFGDSPVLITDTFFVNAPAHMLDTCNEILADEESVREINRGEVGFHTYSYHNEKFNKDCYGVEFD